MAWIDSGARLYVWDLSAPSTAVAPWPMFQHDARHTGASLRTPEVIPPTATITAPGNGSRVAGTVNVTTQASDNVGVVNIELYKDSILVGSSTQSTFTFEWNTTAESDGPYTFVSKAYDAAGNVGLRRRLFSTLITRHRLRALRHPATAQSLPAMRLRFLRTRPTAQAFRKLISITTLR